MGGAWYYGTRAFGEERIPGWTNMARAYYRDALFVGMGGTAVLAALETAVIRANQHLPGAQAGAAANFGANLDAVFPAAAILGSAVRSGLTLTAAAGVTAGFIVSMIRPKWLRAGGFVLAAGALGGFAANWHEPMDVRKRRGIAAGCC